MWLLWNMATGRQGEMGQWVLGLGWVQPTSRGWGSEHCPALGECVSSVLRLGGTQWGSGLFRVVKAPLFPSLLCFLYFVNV